MFDVQLAKTKTLLCAADFCKSVYEQSHELSKKVMEKT